jgi:glycosyl hydrolase family 43
VRERFARLGRQSGMLPLPLAHPVAPAPARADFDLFLESLLGRVVGDVRPASGPGARAAIRRRVALLQRRRRLRHALGSGTLAAGIVAGGVQARFDTGSGGSGAGGAAAATVDTGTATGDPSTTVAPPTTTVGSPTTAPAPSPAPATEPWSRDAAEGSDRDAADPGVLFAGGRVHVFATSSFPCRGGVCAEYRVPRFAAPDLSVAGRLEGDALPERPPWVAADDHAIWAPAAARVGEGYVLWFAATSGRPGDGGMKCLGAATAATPEGPFVARPDPLHCTPGYWSIDPAPVVDGGRLFLLWRQDGDGAATGAIVAAPLTPDGLALAGPATTLLRGAQPWEEGHPGRAGIGPVENPAMARHPATGELLLTWSANLWETQDYATGLAVCDGPLGPCRRTSDQPWLRTEASPGFATSARLGGAGGLSFATGPDGRLYAVLHAYRGAGSFPSAPRAAWAFAVERTGGPDAPYRLIDIS